MFKGCFKSVSRKFQENFHGVSRKFHVAWHSSQLPEQKEGLLRFYRALKLSKHVTEPVRPVVMILNNYMGKDPPHLIESIMFIKIPYR